MSKHIELIVRGVCVQEGLCLLCHGMGKANTYLPGGHIERGESAEAALRRELDEELARRATVGCFLGAVEHTFVHKGKQTCEVNLVFQCDVEGVQAGVAPGSAEPQIEFMWAPLDQLRVHGLEPSPLCERLPVWLRTEGSHGRWASTYGVDSRQSAG